MKKSSADNFKLVNLFESFYQHMVQEEVGSEGSKAKMVLALMPQANRELIARAQEEHSLEFALSLQYFYLQVDKMHLFWMLKEEEEAAFDEDPWLKSEYLDVATEEDDDFEDDDDDFEDFEDDDESKTASDILTGHISINDLEDLFDENAREWMFSFVLSGIHDNWDDFFILETHWELTVLIKKEAGKILDNVWVADPDAGKLYDMQITVERYLELAYLAKGFRKWQLVYLLKDQAPDYELMKRYLPQLFPQVDLDLSDFGI